MDERTRATKDWKHHWKWILPVTVLCLVLLYSLPKEIGTNVLHIAAGYADKEVCDKALVLADKNTRVREQLGALEPLGALAIFEGHVRYSKAKDSVFMALTIKGAKGKGKLDVLAYKMDTLWALQKVAVRLKEPKFRKETISVLEK